MARHFVFYGIARGALLGIFLTVGTVASAATTTLICDTGLPLDMGPTTIELNPGQRTVTLILSGWKERNCATPTLSTA